MTRAIELASALPRRCAGLKRYRALKPRKASHVVTIHTALLMKSSRNAAREALFNQAGQPWTVAAKEAAIEACISMIP
jgi:hypothetical protein